MLYGDIDII